MMVPDTSLGATTDPVADAQRIAEHVRTRMFAGDAASQALGMMVDAIAPDWARVSMIVRPDMLNGFQVCHGGLITALADTAFAFACNSGNRLTVASGIVVDFVAPARGGDRLVAEAQAVARSGRTGVFDVTVINQHGQIVAVLRGRSHTVADRATVGE